MSTSPKRLLAVHEWSSAMESFVEYCKQSIARPCVAINWQTIADRCALVSAKTRALFAANSVATDGPLILRGYPTELSTIQQEVLDLDSRLRGVADSTTAILEGGSSPGHYAAFLDECRRLSAVHRHLNRPLHLTSAETGWLLDRTSRQVGNYLYEGLLESITFDIGRRKLGRRRMSFPRNQFFGARA
jgi:hypothetical protein